MLCLKRKNTKCPGRVGKRSSSGEDHYEDQYGGGGGGVLVDGSGPQQTEYDGLGYGGGKGYSGHPGRAWPRPSGDKRLQVMWIIFNHRNCSHCRLRSKIEERERS